MSRGPALTTLFEQPTWSIQKDPQHILRLRRNGIHLPNMAVMKTMAQQSIQSLADTTQKNSAHNHSMRSVASVLESRAATFMTE